MKQNDITNSSELFFYKARVDFNSAKILFELFEKGEIDIDIEKIYFDLQQSTEKLLKSMLSRYSIRVPKTHDISELIEICSDNSISLIDDIDVLIELSDYAVDGRYSIICDDISDSSLYFELVERLLLDIEKRR